MRAIDQDPGAGAAARGRPTAYLVFQLAYRLHLRNTNDQLEADELSKKFKAVHSRCVTCSSRPDYARQSPALMSSQQPDWGRRIV